MTASSFHFFFFYSLFLASPSAWEKKSIYMTRASFVFGYGQHKDVNHQNNAYRKGLDMGILGFGYWEHGRGVVLHFGLGRFLQPRFLQLKLFYIRTLSGIRRIGALSQPLSKYNSSSMNLSSLPHKPL
jgi:hypothetical protein